MENCDVSLVFQLYLLLGMFLGVQIAHGQVFGSLGLFRVNGFCKELLVGFLPR